MSFKSIAPPSKKLEPHPYSKIMPPMSKEEMDALATDIGKNGVLQPIVIYQGKILDGNHRFQILAMYEFKKSMSFVEFEGSDAEAKAFVISANLHRRHLTPEKRREIIDVLLKADPTQSNRQIAETAKVDHKTVGNQRDKLEASGEIPQLSETVGADGKKRKAKAKKKAQGQSVQARYKAKQEQLIDVLQEFTSVEHAEEYANLTKQRLDQTIANWTETAEAV